MEGGTRQQVHDEFQNLCDQRRRSLRDTMYLTAFDVNAKRAWDFTNRGGNDDQGVHLKGTRDNMLCPNQHPCHVLCTTPQVAIREIASDRDVILARIDRDDFSEMDWRIIFSNYAPLLTDDDEIMIKVSRKFPCSLCNASDRLLSDPTLVDRAFDALFEKSEYHAW